MSTPVGDGIKVPIGGDMTGLQAAVNGAVEKLEALRAKSIQLKGAMELATSSLGAESDALKVLKAESERVDANLKKLVGSEEKVAKAADATAQSMKTASTHGNTLRDTADKLDSKLGKVQIAIGGIAQAAGASGGPLANMVGGMADLAMAMAGGVGAIALAGAAFAALTKYMEDADKAAAALEKRWADMVGESVKVRNSVQEQNRALAEQLAVQLEIAKNPGSPALIAGQAAAARQLLEVEKKRKEVADQMASIQGTAMQKAGQRVMELNNGAGPGAGEMEKVNAITKEELDLVEDQLLPLRAKLKIQQDTGRELGKQVELTGKLEDAQQKANKATEKYQQMLADLKGWKEAGVGVDFKKKLDDLFAYQPVAAPTALKPISDGDLNTLSELIGFLPKSAAAATEMRIGPDNASKAELDHINELVGFSQEGQEKINEVFITELSDVFRDAVDAFKGLDLGKLGAALLSGSGGAAAGKQVGGIVGGAVGAGAAALFGADPTAGAAVGSPLGEALGGIAGGFLDDLVKALEVLTPLFDGLAMIVRALQPGLLVIRELFNAVGMVLEQLAPIVLQLMHPIAAVALVVVRVIEILLEFTVAFMPMIEAILMFVDVLTTGIQWLDLHFFIPIALMVEMLVNGVIDMVNGMTMQMRKVFGEGFGVILERLHMDLGDVIGDFSNNAADLHGAITDNTRAVEKTTEQSLTNVPTGYKVGRLEFDSANVDKGMTFGVVNIYTTRGAAAELDDLKRRNKRGTAASLGRNVVGEDRN